MVEEIMSSLTELSSSFSLSSSSYVSNGSSDLLAPGAAGPQSGACDLEVFSLGKLSSSLENLLFDSEFDCSDAEIVVEGVGVGVHCCILSARSRFFYNLFSRKGRSAAPDGGKPKYYLDELVPRCGVSHEALMVLLGYLYAGKLRPIPPTVSTCVDSCCAHDACPPAVNFVVELTYASFTFQIKELVSLLQRHLLNFVQEVLVEDIIPIIQVAFHCHLDKLLTQCVQRVVRSDLDNILLEKELPHDVITRVKSLRLEFQQPNPINIDPLHEKQIRRIHMALDSDDVELLKMLLSESNVTLDDANGLHYAAAYCDPKIVAEILEHDLANVNLRNARGYTVLHVAARRREPAIVVSLLNKGACASEATVDGRSAARICRKLTRAKDYNAKIQQGEESNKNRLCIDILEREMQRNPMVIDESSLSPMMADDLHMRLDYLENRVAFAKLLFPAEAKVAMEIAQAETTSILNSLSVPRNTSGTLREVDLNETPMMQNKRLRSRVDALQKTVELGRRFFPNCSQVLDKFLEDELPDLLYIEKGTPDMQKIKRLRFYVLKAEVQKAFSKDKAEFDLLVLSSSSSSSSLKAP